MAKMTRPDMHQVPLILITDDKRSRNRSVLDVVGAAVAGGVTCVQFRPWKPCDADFLEQAHALREITARASALLIINDRIDIASLCHADGVHLGAHDIPIPDARRLLGDTGIIGYSAHSLDEAERAARAGADYITYSPVFPTTSTSDPRPAAGPFAAVEVDCAVQVPVFALGGIGPDNIMQLLDLGMEHFAVVSTITQAEDITAAARTLCGIISVETAVMET